MEVHILLHVALPSTGFLRASDLQCWGYASRLSGGWLFAGQIDSKGRSWMVQETGGRLTVLDFLLNPLGTTGGVDSKNST